jgi:hypothetical protein
VTHFDHTSIATGMKCIPLPTRKRGAQSAEAKEEYERALSEWCREIIQTAEQMDFKIGARDWCYVLENAGSLTKGQFDAARICTQSDGANARGLQRAVAPSESDERKL